MALWPGAPYEYGWLSAQDGTLVTVLTPALSG